MPLHPDTWREMKVVNMANFSSGFDNEKHNHLLQSQLHLTNDAESDPTGAGWTEASAPAIAAIAGIFVVLTLTITVMVLVSCVKNNTVFALQKCEQEDIDDDYELNSMIDEDVESTDLEEDEDGESKCDTESKALVKSKKKRKTRSQSSGSLSSLARAIKRHSSGLLSAKQTEKADFHKVLKKQTAVHFADERVELDIATGSYADNVSRAQRPLRTETTLDMQGPRTALLPSVPRSQSYNSSLPTACMLTLLPKSKTMTDSDFSCEMAK